MNLIIKLKIYYIKKIISVRQLKILRIIFVTVVSVTYETIIQIGTACKKILSTISDSGWHIVKNA